ncbi:MAG: hypothetical protein AAGF31_00655 [Planctomycetota bacterium]
MPDRLELPDDLNSLIEKREGEERRTGQQPAPEIAEERRTQPDRRQGEGDRSGESTEP